MRLFLTIALTILCLLTATAQDIIVKINGDTLRVYDLKVNAKFITYRDRPGKESPSRRIGKAKVLSVKKKNGKSIIISRPTPAISVISTTPEVQQPPLIVAQPVQEQPIVTEAPAYEKPKGEVKRAVAHENAAIVGAYNKNHDGCNGKKPKNSKAGCAVAIMGLSPSSVLANEDVEIEISECGRRNDASIQYQIYVQNKSDKIIYLDLENSFRIYNDGTFKPYYSGKQIRQSKKSNEKVSFSGKRTVSRPHYVNGRKTASGGVTFSIEDKVQTTQVVKEQKIISIPPKGKVALPPRISLDAYDEILKEYDVFCATLPAKHYALHDWQVVNIDEQQSPYKNSFIITYSPNKNFDTYSTVNFTLFIRQLIGLGKRFSRFDVTRIQGYDRYTICGEVSFE